MAIRVPALIALSLLGLAGCSASDDREWMKVDKRYTKEEFQRDYKECSRKGDLDDACMRQRGWVSVNPSKAEPVNPGNFDPLAPPGRGGRGAR
jgi:hypothetical protein